MVDLYKTLLVSALVFFAGFSVHAQESTTSQPLVEIHLTAGAELDPFLVSIVGGGSYEANVLSSSCIGFTSQQPTVVLNMTGSVSDPLRVFLYSDLDTVLVVEKPDGSTQCEDNHHPEVLDPLIDVDGAQAGTYRIWAGSKDVGQLYPAFLVVTRNDALTPSTLSLNNLIVRSTAVLPVPTEVARSLSFSQDGSSAEMSVNAPTLVEAVTGGGDILAVTMNASDPTCAGFISAEPSYQFRWTGTSSLLRIFYESDTDTTLLVLHPDGSVHCNDDSNGVNNLNPSIEVTNPENGDYAVYVGGFTPEVMVEGQLTVTVDPSVMPNTLTNDASQGE